VRLLGVAPDGDVVGAAGVQQRGADDGDGFEFQRGVFAGA